MPPAQFPYEAVCPWCYEGKLMIERPADTKISCKCPKCPKYYEVDVKTMTVRKSAAVPNRNRKPPQSKTA
jgi:phage FluMu protein Com